MDPIENPYQPGAGSPPPALTGRDELIAEVDIVLARIARGNPSRSVIPLGLRGVGKTVLLNRFREMAEARGFVVPFIEATEGDRFSENLALELRSTLYRLSSREAALNAVNSALRVLKSFSVTLGSEGLRFGLDIDPERGVADSGNLDRDLADLIEHAGRAAAAAGTAIVIAIDEIQYLDEREFSALIMAMHRISQRRLPVVLLATGLPQVAGLAGAAKSYAERLFTFPRLGALSPEDTRIAIAEPAARLDVTFTDGALNDLIGITHSYPYFIQEWTYRVWNAATQSPITSDDVAGIRDLTISRLDESFFRVRFDRLTDMEKNYLRAMADCGETIRSSAVAQRLERTPNSLGPVRDDLIKKGMIYSPKHGDVAYTVPLFGDFMQRVMPAAPANAKSTNAQKKASAKKSAPQSSHRRRKKKNS